MITIINMTPHPVTIIRRCPNPNGPPDAIIEHRTEYPACPPADLPRAVESHSMDDVAIGIGDMALSCSACDTQGGYANAVSLRGTGLIDFVGYTGAEGLPAFGPGERAFGLDTFRIVSIVTALGALAAGRGIEDLLVPMGQVRDSQGRIIGATGLSPATSLLTPMYRAITKPLQYRLLQALHERNDARRGREIAV